MPNTDYCNEEIDMDHRMRPISNICIRNLINCVGDEPDSLASAHPQREADGQQKNIKMI